MRYRDNGSRNSRNMAEVVWRASCFGSSRGRSSTLSSTKAAPWSFPTIPNLTPSVYRALTSTPVSNKNNNRAGKLFKKRVDLGRDRRLCSQGDRGSHSRQPQPHRRVDRASLSQDSLCQFWRGGPPPAFLPLPQNPVTSNLGNNILD